MVNTSNSNNIFKTMRLALALKYLCLCIFVHCGGLSMVLKYKFETSSTLGTWMTKTRIKLRLFIYIYILTVRSFIYKYVRFKIKKYLHDFSIHTQLVFSPAAITFWLNCYRNSCVSTLDHSILFLHCILFVPNFIFWITFGFNTMTLCANCVHANNWPLFLNTNDDFAENLLSFLI